MGVGEVLLYCLVGALIIVVVIIFIKPEFRNDKVTKMTAPRARGKSKLIDMDTDKIFYTIEEMQSFDNGIIRLTLANANQVYTKDYLSSQLHLIDRAAVVGEIVYITTATLYANTTYHQVLKGLQEKERQAHIDMLKWQEKFRNLQSNFDQKVQDSIKNFIEAQKAQKPDWNKK